MSVATEDSLATTSEMLRRATEAAGAGFDVVVVAATLPLAALMGRHPHVEAWQFNGSIEFLSIAQAIDGRLDADTRMVFVDHHCWTNCPFDAFLGLRRIAGMGR